LLVLFNGGRVLTLFEKVIALCLEGLRLTIVVGHDDDDDDTV
jgi:hypothetical protein